MITVVKFINADTCCEVIPTSSSVSFFQYRIESFGPIPPNVHRILGVIFYIGVT